MSGDIVKCGQCGGWNVASRAACNLCGAPLQGDQPWPSGATATGQSTASGGAFRPSGGDPLAGVRYAAFSRRVVAMLIDLAVLTPIGAGYTLTITRRTPSGDVLSGWGLGVWLPDPYGGLLTLLIWWMYWAGFECSISQASLGKQAVGVRVFTTRGERMSFPRATARFFGKFLWFLPVAGVAWGVIAVQPANGWVVLLLGVVALLIPVVIASVTLKKQGPHDFLSGTVVVEG